MARLASVNRVGNMEFIDLKTQYQRLREPINQRIRTVLERAQFILGAEVAELEQRLADFVGAEHCIAVSSGTDALLIALMALDAGPGDEIITTPFTFVATGGVISRLGAKPVFVDIDRRTYNLDPGLIEAAVTRRTKAVIAVSLFGQCADFDRINAIGAAHDIPVIEDAAQSFGARYKGRYSCGLSAFAAASFYPSKPLGCYGDGGAVFVDDGALANSVRELRVHGQDRSYHHSRMGINGRMDTLQAAVLLAKLDSFAEELEARERLGERYAALIEEAFRDAAPGFEVSPPYREPYNRCIHAQYTIEVPDRAAVRKRMQAKGIPTALHYPVPLHLQPAFEAGDGGRRLPVAEEVAQRVLSLPFHPYLTEDEQVRVVAALKDSVTAPPPVGAAV